MERHLISLRLLLVFLGFSLLALSCVEPLNGDLDRPKAGDVPVILDFTAPSEGVGTKSMVPGTENRVTVMQMICFDARGQYLGIRTVTSNETDYGEVVTSNGVQTDLTQEGRLIARVPEGTARIHFVANRNLTTPLEFTAGTSERVVMRSLALTTAYNDANHQEVIYWGYHREETAEAMTAWLTVAVEKDDNGKIHLKSGVTPHRFLMIRDRARLQLTFESGLIPSGTTVTWLVHNGRNRGLIAPYDATKADPWSDYVQGQGTTTNPYYANVKSTEFADSGRYTLYTSDSVNEDNHFDSKDAYQYVFDDSNEKVGDTEGRIKIILKLTTGSTKQYMVLLLRSNAGQIPIVRNNTYVIHVKSMDGTKYPTLKAAIEGNDFANAPVEVDRTIPTISNETYTLRVALEENPGFTYKLVHQTGPITIPFEFLNASNESPILPSSGDISADDFEVFFENKTYSWSVESVTFNNDKNRWEASVNISTIGGGAGHTNEPYTDYLVIRHKPSGMSRFVHIYAIQKFDITSPDFEKLGSTTFEGRDVYHLSFKLPNTYGEDMYPINIRFATSTLDAYSDSGSNARHGTFGVEVTSTAGVANSTSISDWNYKATSWDYWYIYSIPSYPDGGQVDIYFKDARDKKETAPTSVGLFLDIPHFGDITSYHI